MYEGSAKMGASDNGFSGEQMASRLAQARKSQLTI